MTNKLSEIKKFKTLEDLTKEKYVQKDELMVFECNYFMVIYKKMENGLYQFEDFRFKGNGE